MKKKFSIICLSLLMTTVMMAQDLDRTSWTVTTQTGNNYGYVPDGWSAAESRFTTGMPEQLFDGQTGTYLSLVKPGKSYSPGNGADAVSELADFIPSFTIDLQSAQTFNYIKWNHRNGVNPILGTGSNAYIYLRVFGVNIEKSDNGTDFTPVNTDVIWIPNKGGYVGSTSVTDDSTYTISIAETTSRYIRVKLAVWSDNYKVDGGYQHPDFPGDGAASGSSMQIGEFGLGKASLEGIATPTVSGVSIYPTLIKAGQAFNIRLNDEWANAEIAVYSLLGAKLSEIKTSGSLATQPIDQQGIYIVKVKKNNLEFATKVVVK